MHTREKITLFAGMKDTQREREDPLFPYVSGFFPDVSGSDHFPVLMTHKIW